jgi:hypothetical protein
MGNKVDKVKTEVTEPQMAQAMIEAWKSLFGNQPSKEQIAILMSQNALETGHRAKMWNYNIGNITTGPKWTGDYWEGLDWLYEYLPPDQTGFTPRQKKTIKLQYRAYPTLLAGALDYLKVISSGRYAKAWESILHPNVEAYSKALKQSGYYTADEAPYTKGLQSLFKHFTSNDSYDKAVAGNVTPPSSKPSASAPGAVASSATFWEKLNKMLQSYLGALASDHKIQKKFLDKNEFLIKVNSKDLHNSIEYSRILCEALEEELSSRTYVHSNGKDVEIECKIYGNPFLCKKTINALCNDISQAFKYATNKCGNIEIETKVLVNKKSEIQYLDEKLADSSYRKFRLHLLSKQG